MHFLKEKPRRLPPHQRQNEQGLGVCLKCVQGAAVIRNSSADGGMGWDKWEQGHSPHQSQQHPTLLGTHVTLKLSEQHTHPDLQDPKPFHSHSVFWLLLWPSLGQEVDFGEAWPGHPWREHPKECPEFAEKQTGPQRQTVPTFPSPTSPLRGGRLCF